MVKNKEILGGDSLPETILGSTMTVWYSFPPSNGIGQYCSFEETLTQIIAFA